MVTSDDTYTIISNITQQQLRDIHLLAILYSKSIELYQQYSNNNIALLQFGIGCAAALLTAENPANM